MLWDLFCRVIDNHGDVGVCWRLAADLAARGEPVRLWIDDASALRWMAPNGATGVTVLPWPTGDAPPGCGDAVIEAFGCELPESVLRQMAAAARPPVWINLEYLSAEPFVERAHRLPSPQSVGPGAVTQPESLRGPARQRGGLFDPGSHLGLVEVGLVDVDPARFLARASGWDGPQ